MLLLFLLFRCLGHSRRHDRRRLGHHGPLLDVLHLVRVYNAAQCADHVKLARHIDLGLGLPL